MSKTVRKLETVKAVAQITIGLATVVIGAVTIIVLWRPRR